MRLALGHERTVIDPSSAGQTRMSHGALGRDHQTSRSRWPARPRRSHAPRARGRPGRPSRRPGPTARTNSPAPGCGRRRRRSSRRRQRRRWPPPRWRRLRQVEARRRTAEPDIAADDVACHRLLGVVQVAARGPRPARRTARAGRASRSSPATPAHRTGPLPIRPPTHGRAPGRLEEPRHAARSLVPAPGRVDLHAGPSRAGNAHDGPLAELLDLDRALVLSRFLAALVLGSLVGVSHRGRHREDCSERGHQHHGPGPERGCRQRPTSSADSEIVCVGRRGAAQTPGRGDRSPRRPPVRAVSPSTSGSGKRARASSRGCAPGTCSTVTCRRRGGCSTSAAGPACTRRTSPVGATTSR